MIVPILAAFVASLVSGANARLDEIEVDLKQERLVIYPGAPLGFSVVVRHKPGQVGKIAAASLMNTDLQVRITDEAQEVVCQSSTRAYRLPTLMREQWSVYFDQHDEAQRDYVFSEWCSTALPTGEYTVTYELLNLGVMDQVGVSPEDGTPIYAGEVHHYASPLHWEFPLTVLDRNDSAVMREYETWMTKAKERGAGPEVARRRLHAVERIVYAQCPLALPYQLRLFAGEVRAVTSGFNLAHAIHLALAYIETDDAEIAGALAALVMEDEEHDPAWKEVVIWTLHEMHARRNPAVVRETQLVVDAYPKPEDPRPIPGMD